MNPMEAKVYSRLVGLIGVCNTELVSLIIAVKLSIDGLALRLGWLVHVSMYELHAEELYDYLAECTSEPITESAFRKLKRPLPSWGKGYDVRPDGAAESVASQRKCELGSGRGWRTS
jgi:hypothetical protein